MFEKKEVIFSETQGVCMVHDITKLTEAHGNTILYYVLKNVYHKEKVSYIPVEGHKVVLRELMSGETAEKLYESVRGEKEINNMDDLTLQELAYVLHMKPEELRPQEEEAPAVL